MSCPIHKWTHGDGDLTHVLALELAALHLGREYTQRSREAAPESQYMNEVSGDVHSVYLQLPTPDVGPYVWHGSYDFQCHFGFEFGGTLGFGVGEVDRFRTSSHHHEVSP